MTGWLVLAGSVVHAAGILATLRAVALRILDRVAQINLRSRHQLAKSYREEDRERVIAAQGPLVSDLARRDALIDAMFFAAVWPLYWLGRGVMALSRRAPLTSRTEIVEAERRELAALRQLAQDHGLPMPEEPR